jgi:signal transduction histidine kinase
MRRSVWIFLASIFLPSLGLAWMAVRSTRDQQVVLEHQQVIICQNITDTLAQNIQSRMDGLRDDFVSTTQQLLNANASPQILAEDFNRKLRDAWPMAEIGFAVNLDGKIYSPKTYEGPEAQTFRSENDRFLSNRENVEVYSSNSGGLTQNSRNTQNFFEPQKALVNASNLSLQKETARQTDLEGATDKQTANLEKDSDAADSSKVAMARDAFRSRNPELAPGAAGALDELQAKLQAPATAAAPTQAATPAATTPPLATNASAAPATPVPQSASADFLAAKAMASHAASKVRASANGTAEEAARDKNFDIAATTSPAPVPNSMGSSINASTDAAAADTGLSTMAPSSPQGGSAISSGSIATAQSSTDTPAPGGAGQAAAKIQRQVVPQKMPVSDTAALSNTLPEESDFRRVIGSEPSGGLARFLENKLRLMVWSHPADTTIVFGAQLDQTRLANALKSAFQMPELQPDSLSRPGRSDYCVAILDDTGRPVALSVDGFRGDWKHPFVATEIGEALPHWEAALYLVDPQQIGRAARTLQATLALIVLVLVAAIVSGGSLIATDVRRQMRLAQQKTDFVSNVSHELKTPLTSIRMFADLLAEKRVPDEQRQSTYLRIISAEAARLTRLINNVLDFARLERGAPPGEHRDCDLVDAVRDVAETCAPHLEAAGVIFQSEIEADALPIHGDRDALAQIILNLISNAEKYGGSDILVRVRRQETPSGALGCVDVLDRGPGIPAAQVRTVFEPFHRLDDSLSSGIPGSGLGLTLARRMARSHGGDVTYSPRAGGGSCFTLTVPLAAAK